MSNAHSIPSGSPSNEDGMNLKKIVLVGVVSLVIFALSAVAAAIILHKDTAAYAERGVAPRGTEIGKAEVGMVDMVTFEGDTRLDHWKAEKARVLGSYGWVDRQKGRVHIPIAEAMKEVVRQAGGGGSTP